MPGAELRTDFWLSEYIDPWNIYQHGITAVLEARRTPYQQLFIVEAGSFGKALVLDGKWQSSVADEFLYHEALVHPAMIAHGHPENVLILGGGEGATAREVLRWKSVRRVVMVDLDGEVVEACRRHLPEMHQGAFDDPRCSVVIANALDFLRDGRREWDVIISDLSDPIEHGPSYALFTQEYFEMVHGALRPGGRFVVQAGSVSPVEITLHARLARTVGSVFRHVVSYSSHVPSYGAPWGFLLGSDESIDTHPDPQAIDRLLGEATSGGLRFLDGQTLLGLLQTPRHIRQAIEQESRIYTLKEPPRAFGRGVAER